MAMGDCQLEVNMKCNACKMKTLEMMSSIAGGAAVTFDRDAGQVRISGELDPNIVMKAMNRNPEHAEVKWLQLNIPNPRQKYNNTYGYGGSYGQGQRYYNTSGGSYGHYDPYGHHGYGGYLPVREGMYHEIPLQTYNYPNTRVSNSSYGYGCGSYSGGPYNYYDYNHYYYNYW